jgi:hypothetical protein
MASRSAALSAKLRARRGAEEVLQQRLALAGSDLASTKERLESALAAVASFSAAEPWHAAEKAPAARAVLAALHALVVDFGMRLEALGGAAREATATLAARKRALALQMTKHRNKVLLIGLFLQLLASSFGFCSMMSGWYGMNLNNGTCGPDGCNVWGELLYAADSASYASCLAAGGGDCGAPPVDYWATLHGWETFQALVIGSSLAVAIAGGSLWVYILHLF